MVPVETPDAARLADPVFAERYRAISSRDARFDGQFVTGVHSTGIYCRPSCPARPALPRNVTFYPTAAAAQHAGLRACKRCLPDAVPGSPEWNLRDDLTTRAMRLIVDGCVEREGVTGLARRLGYTPRHLSRVLTAELGAGPLALARAERAQTARLLLTETTLGITDVAFAAGFSSVRQFNDTISAVYACTPTALRRRRRHPGPTGTSTRLLTLRLPVRAPFDGAGVLRFLAARAIEGVETADDGSYSRTLRLPHGSASITLRPSGTAGSPTVTCEASLSDVADLAPLVGRVRRLADLDADAEAVDATLATDPALAPCVAAAPGIRLPGSVSGEEIVFRALLGQQVSVRAARTALGDLAAALGERTDHGLLFPTASAIAERGRGVLRGPASRVNAIVRVAEALATGELVADIGQSADELTARLTALPGIGPWTAGYVAMRVLSSPDILLTSDLGIRHGAARLGLPATPAGLERHAAAWAPWRSYAGMHLWRHA